MEVQAGWLKSGEYALSLYGVFAVRLLSSTFIII